MLVALFKIPFIAVAMLGLQVTTTPPHLPPSIGEIVPSTSLEVFIRLRSGPIVFKAICWTAALAEILTIIIYSDLLPSRLSLSVLPYIIASDCASNVRPTMLFFIGSFLAALGGYIRHRCYYTLGHLFTFEMSIRRNHTLVTKGPYSVVRHPGYAGVLLTVAGMACWHLSSGSWALECGIFATKIGQGAAAINAGLVVTVVAGLLLRIPAEDTALRSCFRNEWEQWAREVPYKLVPGLY